MFFSGHVTHSVENMGNTPVHNLIVELKGGEAAGSNHFESAAEAEGTLPAGSDL